MKQLITFLCAYVMSIIIANAQKDNNSKYENPADSIIRTCIQSISADTIESYMYSLQNFGTRYALAPNRKQVAEWIKSKFESFGYTDVVLDSFKDAPDNEPWYVGTDSMWHYNVVATLSGATYPENHIIIGGHYDCALQFPYGYWPQYGTVCPGADDNASGTSGTLEIARVLKINGFIPEKTIKFIAFAGEELGFLGSTNYADKAFQSNTKIDLMINMDMISYATGDSSQWRLEAYHSRHSFQNFFTHCFSSYSFVSPEIMLGCKLSDDLIFSMLFNYLTMGFGDYEWPGQYYHTLGDTVGNYNMEFCKENLKAICPILMHYSNNIIMDQLHVFDIGNGSQIKANWHASNVADLFYYKVQLGTASGIYDTTFFTTDTTLNINNLVEGTTYFIAVTVVDIDGFISADLEKSIVPLLNPHVPIAFNAEPNKTNNLCSWNSNKELDLAGYNLYRSTDANTGFAKINNTPVVDTFYVDNTASPDIYYYYKLTAVDLDNNESDFSNMDSARLASMNHGILVVDDSEGGLLSPTDVQVDEFYNQLLSDYYSTNFDAIDLKKISVSDLGWYSSVIWHSQNTQSSSILNDNLPEVKKYLDLGGNILFTLDRPSRAFYFNLNTYPFIPENNSFLTQYLKIDTVDKKTNARFNGAIGQQNWFPDIFTDTFKTLSSINYHIANIETLSPTEDGIIIYSFHSDYNSNTPQGSMNGMPVGIAYSGNNYNAITLSFPLYYMDYNQAKTLTNYIMHDVFGEEVGIKETKKESNTNLVLFAPTPNPCKDYAKIKFNLPIDGNVKISLNSITGSQMLLLADQSCKAGINQVDVNTSGLNSGIYYLILETAAGAQSRKLIVIK